MWRPPQRLVHESLLGAAATVPGKEAIVDEYGSRAYAGLADDALRFARLLQDEGLERGDRVALYLDNTALCASAIFGVLLAGGAFTFVNPQTKAGKLSYILDNSEASFLVAEAHSAAIAGFYGRTPASPLKAGDGAAGWAFVYLPALLLNSPYFALR
jgi:acyl-CoA synthetase (AMP-forming)/AMP-acid ligase II